IVCQYIYHVPIEVSLISINLIHQLDPPPIHPHQLVIYSNHITSDSITSKSDLSWIFQCQIFQIHFTTSGPPTPRTEYGNNVCSDRNRPRRNIRFCRGLQKDLRDGRVKGGTVLPANFAFKGNSKRDHPYRNTKNRNRGRNGGNNNYSNNVGGSGRNDNPDKSRGYEQRKKRESNSDGDDSDSDDNRRNVYRQERRETGLIALNDSGECRAGPTWTIDSGCTRQVTHEAQWFSDISASCGSITVGGKNKIPIEGVGRVELDVIDSKGNSKTLTLHGVLYAPKLQFSLLSVPAAHEFRFHFDCKQCPMQTDQRFKIKAPMATNTDLYQFQAKSAANASALTAMAGKQRSLLLLHKHLGHPNVRILHDLTRSEAVRGLDGSTSVNPTEQFFCRACTLAKSHRAPFYSNRVVERARAQLQKVHTDICGPLPVNSLTGCRYFVIFIDDFSRFMFTYPMKTRGQLYECYEDSRKKALNIFRHDIGMLEWRPCAIEEHDIQVLQADNAKEYEKLGRVIFREYGTHAQFTNAYTPQQNGVAERRMRTIMESVRALLLDGKLPKQLWAECVGHVTTLLNMTSSATTSDRTPYELWYNRIPSMQYIKVFGCNAYVHITEQYRDKLDARAKLCMHLGIPDHKKGYRLLDLDTHVIFYSRDVIFKEDEYPSLANLTDTPDQSSNDSVQRTQTQTLAPVPAAPAVQLSTTQRRLPPLREALDRTELHYFFRTETTNPSSTSAPKRPRLNDDETEVTLNSEEDIQEQEQHQQLLYTLLAIRYVSEPTTYREALASSHAKQWRKAANSEFKSLMDNKTWVLVPRPKGRKILRSRWVFVVKYTGTGEIDSFKARLVIKGFLQEYGIDYNEIFSPVIRMEVLRLLLTIAAILNLEIHQMDVKTAFLNGFLEEEICMAQPEGFTTTGQEDLVCKLIKSLYGLNQTPRVWYQTLSAFLEKLGFSKLIKDSCVFIRTIDGVTCYIAVYVDDLLIIAPTRALIIKISPEKKFSTTDLGEVKYLFGWSTQRDRKNRTVFVHQHKYATKIINRFSDYIPYPIATPADRNVKLSVSSQPATEAEKDAMKSYPYREAVGSIMYLMVGTRPDMVFYMREVSQFLANLEMEHWNAVVRGLKYLAGTKDYGICLGGSQEVSPENLADRLTAYSDSDYANCPDTRRSVGGYVTMLSNSPISWLSRKHHTVVLSTTEAEYIAMCHCMQEMIFLKLLLRELGCATTQPNLIHEDNQSCIKLFCYNPELHGRSKHIHVRYCFVQEKVERHEFSVVYCNTKDMVADNFTNV
ncbi:LOW QUALITY PROTEIN: Integrase catalytic core protein, partial [Phytophthora palmivora]